MATQKMIQIDFRKYGILLLLLCFFLMFAFPIFHHQIIGFAESYLSNDHEITPNGFRELVSTYYFMIGLLLGVGYFLINLQKEEWRKKIKEVFLKDSLGVDNSVRLSPRQILIISTIAGLFLIVSMRLAYRFPIIYPFFYQKDHGLIDLYVPTIMAISAALLILAVWNLRKHYRSIQNSTGLIAAYSILIFLFIFYAGEEISWGQDFFRWQTPALFDGNVENQTNLHNYFNAYFDYGYIALSLVLVSVLVSAWLWFTQRWPFFSKLIMPHPSLIGLSTLIAFVSTVWFPEQELLEEMMAAFVFFYCLRIFFCTRSKNLAIESLKG